MIYLLYISVAYLIILSVILWSNKRNLIPLRKSNEAPISKHRPLVSICIPARNEEDVIERAVTSVLSQDYPNFEIIVLDDQSTDSTPKILKKLSNNNQYILKIINGKMKPDNWLGKSWACDQLSKKASGEILFFIDADVWLEPQAVQRAVLTMQYYSVDFLTVWPIQKMATFWEKIVIPIVYYGLLSLLPVRYVHQKPPWMPVSLAKRFAPSFAAACGQCMVFSKDVYTAIGGHQSVKNEIIEDVALARQIKRQGYKMRMHYGEKSVYCRMYASENAMWQGFRKNFLALYNYSIVAFCLMAVLNFIVYVLPFLILPIVVINGLGSATIFCLTAIFIIYAHRIILARWFHWSIPSVLAHPVGVLWFHALGFQVLVDYFGGHAPKWKDRET